jgi:hypothetical protein
MSVLRGVCRGAGLKKPPVVDDGGDRGSCPRGLPVLVLRARQRGAPRAPVRGGSDARRAG